MSFRPPTPESLSAVDYRPPRRSWRDPRVEFRQGTYNHAALPKHLEYLGLPNPREWQPHDADWKLPEDWRQIILDGMRERLERLPLVPPVHGHLRALRRVRRQVPLLHRLGRPEEHARAARRAAPVGLSPLFHGGGPPLRRGRRRARPDRGRAQGVVLLLLPVHRVPPLLGVLPVRHRHGGNHDDRPRAAEPGGPATSTG